MCSCEACNVGLQFEVNPMIDRLALLADSDLDSILNTDCSEKNK